MVDAIGAAASSTGLITPNQAGTVAAPAASAPANTANPVNAAASPKKTSVNISSNARAKIAQEQKKKRADTSDIDNSGLDDRTKSVLKKIRELQQQLQDKVQEMQQVMSDKALTPKQRDQNVTLLRSEINSLESAINDATEALNESLSSARASSDQRDLAHALMHP